MIERNISRMGSKEHLLITDLLTYLHLTFWGPGSGELQVGRRVVVWR